MAEMDLSEVGVGNGHPPGSIVEDRVRVLPEEEEGADVAPQGCTPWVHGLAGFHPPCVS